MMVERENSLRQPVRTCVVCRQKSSRTDLIRVINCEGSAVVDVKKSLAGRGAWLHPSEQCFLSLKTQHVLRRALRASTDISVDALVEFMKDKDRSDGQAVSTSR